MVNLNVIENGNEAFVPCWKTERPNVASRRRSRRYNHCPAASDRWIMSVYVKYVHRNSVFIKQSVNLQFYICLFVAIAFLFHFSFRALSVIPLQLLTFVRRLWPLTINKDWLIIRLVEHLIMYVNILAFCKQIGVSY